MDEIYIIYFVIAIAVFTGVSALLWYAFRFEPVNFTVTEQNINIRLRNKNRIREAEDEAEKKDNDFLKILHLSDLHLRTDYKGRRLVSFLKILSLDSYDFIFITGDMVENNSLHSHLAEVLKNFQAKYGIYTVLGAHDYYSKKPIEFLLNMFKKKESYSRKNDFNSLKKRLEKIGIKVLLNENIILNKRINGFNAIKIIGVDDPLINKMDLKESLNGIKENPQILRQKNFLNTEQYREAMSLSPDKSHYLQDENALQIALIHTPDSNALVNLALNGTDIIFAGHTHGGQIRIPGKGALISGCNIKTKFASGLFYFKDFVLQISRGLGEGRFSRLRILCQPEAIITKLFLN